MFFCPKLYRYISKFCRNGLLINMNKCTNKCKKTVSAIARPVCSVDTSNRNVQENTQFRVLTTPVKSESDKKEYRVIQLENGLVACLISDNSPISEQELNEDSDHNASETDESMESGESENEGTEDEADLETFIEDDERPIGHKLPEQKMAAAGLCIGVGSFSDPKAVPGMAHFLEHMVFMGSKKYPKENSFDEYIKQNGGSTNASTDAETTVFYFECLEKYLEEALDRFSQFFIAPLMKREAMTRERESIESEFQMSVPSDASRKEQLLCNLAKENSPVNSFSWGNLITLRDNINDDDLYEGVHEFRKRHYSAHRMTLTVQARLTLDTLEQYVLTTFSKVPNNGLAPDDFSDFHKNVFDTPEFRKIYNVNPIKDLSQVDITWALPSLKQKYKSKPHHFISYLLGDEGKGSLLSYLKKKLWVIATTIGTEETGIEHNSLYTLFTINLTLTEQGYIYLRDVIETVFSYLRMLKEAGPQRRIFEELQSISTINFKYAHEESAVEIVETMCEAMQFYPPADYITGSELYFEFDPDTINMLLHLMTPERANYVVFKRLNDKELELSKTEKWFGTRYLDKGIPNCWLKQWENAPIIPELSVPPPNDFITTDFDILPNVLSKVENNPEYPQKILENSSIELWYRADVKFKLPMAYYYFYLISPLSIRDVKHHCMLETLVNLLSMNISEELYPAASAGLSSTFTAFEKGLVVKVWGFNEKLPTLINLIAKYLVNLKHNITEDRFEVIKDKLLKHYYNKLLKPSNLAKDIRLNLIADNNWNPLDYHSAMTDISFNEMKEYSHNVFKDLYVKVLIQGNVDESIALNTVTDFMKILNYSALKTEDIPRYSVVRLNKGELCCRIKSLNNEDSNSIITNYYQSDLYTIENSVLIDLIMMVIEEPLFDTLRTKEQLGYDVHCSVRDTFGVLGFTITVNAQATKVTTNFVDTRIETFLKYTQSLLNDLDEKSFAAIKENLIKMKKCADIRLKEEVDRNWSEITSEDYIFSRIKQEIETIERTDLNQLRSWWNTHNSFAEKENFRKISIQIDGSKNEIVQTPVTEIKFLDNEGEANEKGNKDYFIKSINEFKKTVKVFNVK